MKLAGHGVNTALGLLMSYNDFRNARAEGHGSIYSAGKALWNYALWSQPVMMWAGMAYGVGEAVIGSAQHHTQAGIMGTGHFGRGVAPDNEAINHSRSYLYQSAVGAQTGFSLTGHSWAGNEAAIFHRRFGA